MTMVPDQPNELVLTESRTMRAQTAGRVDVLDKVKALALLPDGVHATTEIVASYFEVDASTIDSLAAANREELAENGRRVLRGTELREFATPFGGVTNLGLSPKARSLAVFSRRAVLNVGQLLTKSDVARQVRTYLLNLEEQAPVEQRVTAAAGPVPYREQAEIVAVLAQAGVLPESYATATAKIIIARSMGERPALDPSETPLYAATFLAEKGHSSKVVEKFQSGFGARASNHYLKVHGRRPEKVPGPAGSRIDKVVAYTEEDRPLLEQVYAGIADLIEAFEVERAGGQLALAGGAR